MLRRRSRTPRPDLFLWLAGVVLAATLFRPPDALAVDKFAAEFLRIGIGARALGMGGSFVSIADDASATYWNPAGLVQLESREAMGMHASQFGGVVNHDVLGVATPLHTSNRRVAIGLTAIRLGVDHIKVTKDAKVGEDANGNPIIDPNRVEERSAYDLAFLLTYARSMSDRVSTGLNVKVIRQSLVGEGASFGIGFDLGVLYHPNPTLAVGARFTPTTRIFWDTGRRETVSPTLTLGAHTTRQLDALQGSLTLGLDAGFSFEGQQADQFQTGNLSGNLLPGVEYWFRNTVALRAGSDSGNFTAGAGVRYKQVGADYAYLSHDQLDATHRISALIRF